MRLSLALTCLVAVASLACGNGTVRDAKVKGCEEACQQAEKRCEANCTDGAGHKVCVAACTKVEGECVDRCLGR